MSTTLTVYKQMPYLWIITSTKTLGTCIHSHTEPLTDTTKQSYHKRWQSPSCFVFWPLCSSPHMCSWLCRTDVPVWWSGYGRWWCRSFCPLPGQWPLHSSTTPPRRWGGTGENWVIIIYLLKWLQQKYVSSIYDYPVSYCLCNWLWKLFSCVHYIDEHNYNL